tara:strand:- start:3887 stop:4588 length:702 start_codon:yes stop_codon:yes gene_type:complete
MEYGFEEAWALLKAQNPKYLGGSTGAVQHTMPDGRQVVVKRGAHPAHIQNEYDMNRYLNALGVGVPHASMHEDKDGNPLMMTEYEENARRPTSSLIHDVKNFKFSDKGRLRRDFVPQALIANWDVLGMNMDNVLIRPDGTPTYVDVGGAGPYRAQGAPKGDAFGPRVEELESMQSKPPHTERFYGGMGEEEMGRSFDAYGGQDAMEQALSTLRDAQTRNIMQQRIEDVARRVA